MMTRLYAWLLGLYPRKFRSEFGAEMQAVFAQSIAERTGHDRALGIFFRELKEFPANLLHQHWLELKKEANTMTAFSASDDRKKQGAAEARQTGTWGAAVFAGLPHFLMGLLIGFGKLSALDVYEISPTTSLVIGIGLAGLVIVMLAFAWRRGWPLWSASWYLYGAWVSFAVISLTLEGLNLEQSWRYTNILFLIWILVCIVGYFALLFKSKLHGLLSVAFLFPLLGLMLVEFVPNEIEGWLSIGLSFLAALIVGTIVRIGDFRIGLGLVLGLNLIAGLSIAYISEYKMLDLPGGVPAHVPQFGNFLTQLGLYSLFGLGVVAIPFILRGLWNIGKGKLA